MKPGLLVLLSMCALAAALVPRHRRDLDHGNIETICASTTPCAWTTYRPGSNIVDMTITNSYCRCDQNMECQITEEKQAPGASIHRCREPKEDSES